MSITKYIVAYVALVIALALFAQFVGDAWVDFITRSWNA